MRLHLSIHLTRKRKTCCLSKPLHRSMIFRSTKLMTGGRREFDVGQASRLKGPEARKWFAKQLMIPEWMIDVPDRLNHDWYVFARPAGKRCFVVSSKGTTVSRLRNGAVLHHFPSALPSGSRKKTVSDPSQSYSVLDCIFHELDQTYYVIDMVCWRGYSLHYCTAEFRFNFFSLSFHNMLLVTSFDSIYASLQPKDVQEISA
ncbi:unnamed protein product [Rhodiola kirilowii]